MPGASGWRSQPVPAPQGGGLVRGEGRDSGPVGQRRPGVSRARGAVAAARRRRTTGQRRERLVAEPAPTCGARACRAVARSCARSSRSAGGEGGSSSRPPTDQGARCLAGSGLVALALVDGAKRAPLTPVRGVARGAHESASRATVMRRRSPSTRSARYLASLRSVPHSGKRSARLCALTRRSTRARMVRRSTPSSCSSDL